MSPFDSALTGPFDQSYRWVEVTATEMTNLPSVVGGGNTSRFSAVFVFPDPNGGTGGGGTGTGGGGSSGGLP
jgi:hypothetical protein